MCWKPLVNIDSPYIYELLEDYIMDKCKIDYIDQYVNYHLTIIKKKPNFFIKKIKKLSKGYKSYH